MSHHSVDWGLVWNIWCYSAGILWPLTWLFSRKKELTDAEKWAIAQEIIQQPAQLPDGTLQRAELVWKAYEAPTADGPQSRPTISVSGQRAPV